MTKFALVFGVIFTIASCDSSKKERENQQHYSRTLDSLIDNTRWIAYNRRYDDTVTSTKEKMSMPLTYGELDYQVDTVEQINDTTIIDVAPTYLRQKFPDKHTEPSLNVVVGYVNNSEMPFFFVSRELGTQWFPQKPYRFLGDELDTARLRIYLDQHGVSVNDWFRNEAERRIQKMRLGVQQIDH